MSSTDLRVHPPDQAARNQALDPARSFLVQAPAGSGKTDLLTRRFLRLLAEVEDPGQIVAITFTKASAAEMRHRILGELERVAAHHEQRQGQLEPDQFSMTSLAARALEHSRRLGWNLIELPGQLRITTIDAFCREIALQQPLVSELGSGIEIAENPRDLYRRAARRTLQQIGAGESELSPSIESLLLWRDNGWQEMEDLLVEMLAKRDRWMQGFVLDRQPDWKRLRQRLERPFARAVREKLETLNTLIDRIPEARVEAVELARFACGNLNSERFAAVARGAHSVPITEDGLDEVREACCCLADMLQTQKGEWRSEKGVNATMGFPATDSGRAAKKRLARLIASLAAIPEASKAISEICSLPPARYSEDDWHIVQACFELLVHAAAQLKVVFAEEGGTDYTEVAQIALGSLKGDAGVLGEAALFFADNIHHLLVDEFQDTSRRQHELLRHLVGAWPDRAGRTCFVVGDPMQSIYFFRDADAELFSRVKTHGLESAGEQPLVFEFAPLRANFRTAHDLVKRLNTSFEAIFGDDDGSQIQFAHAVAARKIAGNEDSPAGTPLRLHCAFMPASRRGGAVGRDQRERIRAAREEALRQHVEEIVGLIRHHLPRVEAARLSGEKYRVAILGRARRALVPIAEALRAAAIPFLAVDLEDLRERPEILDAVALGRALLNPHDRVAWLGVLRAPWCGLSLADLHMLVSADDPGLQKMPVPQLLLDRAQFISAEGRAAVARVIHAAKFAVELRAAQPSLAVGSWLAQTWQELDGDLCADAAARVNLNLLWGCLDKLPGGEQDLLGPALKAALKDLKALPDPAADSECGVQLMTIHGAKGLEFEVVVVPELQAGNGAGTNKDLLAWLERGLSESDDPEETTEFLVAPLQAKGSEAGSTRRFVIEERRRREAQEMRRLLYVAATRAREELHLFARPEFATNADGMRELVTPAKCLLETSWPAFETEIRERFRQWDVRTAPEQEEGNLEQVAAAGAESLLVFPQTAAPVRVRRLPEHLHRGLEIQAAPASETISGLRTGPAYMRHEGGLRSRVIGIAVHALLQRLASLVAQSDWAEARKNLASFAPNVVAQARGAGIDRPQAEQIVEQALEMALAASHHPAGRWILSPHAEAASEARWAGTLEKGLHQVQVDRIFRAGQEPQSAGENTWWIIDYKTAHAEGLDLDHALAELRKLFAPQLEAYAHVLRQMQGSEARVHAGLYYPRMMRFDWWEIKAISE